MFCIVTGGSASGKIEYAESLVISSDARQRFYIATMKPWDEEGARRRIQKHRAMRAGKGFENVGNLWKMCRSSVVHNGQHGGTSGMSFQP